MYFISNLLVQYNIQLDSLASCERSIKRVVQLNREQGVVGTACFSLSVTSVKNQNNASVINDSSKRRSNSKELVFYLIKLATYM